MENIKLVIEVASGYTLTNKKNGKHFSQNTFLTIEKTNDQDIHSFLEDEIGAEMYEYAVCDFHFAEDYMAAFDNFDSLPTWEVK